METTDSRAAEFSALRRSALVAPELSPWTQGLEARFSHLTTLPSGWDGYRGKPVSRSIAEFAKYLIGLVYVDGIPAPQLVPGGDGSLQLEWHHNQYDLEIDVLAPDEVVASLSDHVSGEEQEIVLAKDFSKLIEWVRNLASRPSPKR